MPPAAHARSHLMFHSVYCAGHISFLVWGCLIVVQVRLQICQTPPADAVAYLAVVERRFMQHHPTPATPDIVRQPKEHAVE
jgi:hypothetical protein